MKHLILKHLRIRKETLSLAKSYADKKLEIAKSDPASIPPRDFDEFAAQSKRCGDQIGEIDKCLIWVGAL